MYVPPFEPVIVGVSLSLVVDSGVHCPLYGPNSYVCGEYVVTPLELLGVIDAEIVVDVVPSSFEYVASNDTVIVSVALIGLPEPFNNSIVNVVCDL